MQGANDIPGKITALEESLRNAFKVMSRDLTVFEGMVSDFDPDSLTCSVTVGDDVSSIEYDNVYLQVLVIEQSDYVCIPNVGSHCTMQFRDGNQSRRQLIKADSLAKIIAAPTLWQFGDGTNGGLPKVTPVTNSFNQLENSLNIFKDLLESWTPVPGDGGAALKTILTAWASTMLVVTEIADLANVKVVQ